MDNGLARVAEMTLSPADLCMWPRAPDELLLYLARYQGSAQVSLRGHGRTKT